MYHRTGLRYFHRSYLYQRQIEVSLGRGFEVSPDRTWKVETFSRSKWLDQILSDSNLQAPIC